MIVRFVHWLMRNRKLRVINPEHPLFSRGYIYRSKRLGIFYHKFHRDDDPQYHCHPWNNISIVLTHGYIEQTPSGDYHRKPGDVIFRKAEEFHRVVLLHDRAGNVLEPESLFIVGKRRRLWGFIPMYLNGRRTWQPAIPDQPIGGLV